MDDSNNSTTSGAVVDIYPCSGSVQQNWTIETNGAIQVHGLCLDTQGGAIASGTDVVLDTCNGGNSQVWTVGSTYALVNKAANLCLADPNSSTTKGTQLIFPPATAGRMSSGGYPPSDASQTKPCLRSAIPQLGRLAGKPSRYVMRRLFSVCLPCV